MFQYISCYSLSMWIRPCDNRPWVSIHLMLLFIEGTKDTIDNSGKFQYISCYSLSGRHSKIRLRSYCFNTSHVTLYRQRAGKIWQTVICFNTSHVTLYQDKSISIIRKQTRFNTSHVTLYQNVDRVVKLCIRCFNTSHVTLYHNMVSALPGEKTFQYISCYSLSGVNADWINTGARFNTSHVTLYR